MEQASQSISRHRYLRTKSVAFNAISDQSSFNKFLSVPYDDNYVALKSPLFKDTPETNYVNASRIKFPGLEQTFIASQAPLPGSFAHFWQMVMEEKVEVIVMVTQLVEGKKVKAHQY